MDEFSRIYWKKLKHKQPIRFWDDLDSDPGIFKKHFLALWNSTLH